MAKESGGHFDMKQVTNRDVKVCKAPAHYVAGKRHKLSAFSRHHSALLLTTHID